MKYFYSFFIFFLLSNCVYSQQIANQKDGITITQQKQIDSLKSKILLFESQIKDLKNDFDSKYEFQKQITETSFNGISAQLSATSNNLTAASIFLALIAIVATAYITYVEKKVIRITAENKKVLNTHKAIKHEVDELNKLIKDNLTGLYIRLKDEETESLIYRLSEVPEDIVHIGSTLLTRDIPKKFYNNLKQSYLKMREIKTKLDESSIVQLKDYPHTYLSIFFQFFAGESLLDPEIKDDINMRLEALIRNSYSNDIVKTTEDLFKAIIKKGMKQERELVNRFLFAVEDTQYAQSAMIYSIVFECLETKKNRYDFYQLLNTPIMKALFGRSMLNMYWNRHENITEKALNEEMKNNVEVYESYIENKKKEQLTKNSNN